MIVAIQDQIWAGIIFDHQCFGGSNTSSFSTDTAFMLFILWLFRAWLVRDFK